ncbi:hypothetical protein H4R21_000009 [Coemansia helicoidea]|uniref:Uncharacterized protein n=1 Tax=Coemansia helicoidea TaxID=1286919 RepID=A0ACC1LHL5_9FUNG|nr:hypothetical protein H4R21_000009 [Coemansia helicoidea]
MAAPLSAALAVPAPLVLLPDAQTLAQQVDMAAVAAAVAGGLGMAPAPLPGTPVGTPSMQAFQAQQQADDLFALHQAGLVADMGAGMPLVAASQTHSRRTSVIDAMVAAYPAGALGGAAPHVMQGPPAAGTGTATSASASAVPSPYATPSIAATGGPMPVGHQRQLSGIPPAVMHGQPAGLVPMDSPAMLATGPHTLAAGTPTSFGQLPFQMGGPHHGHSRHLSLDMANIRLMAAEAASLQGMPLHGPVPGHSAQMVNALQLETAAHHHQLQQQLQNIQQLQQLQQFQMHPKCGPLTIRTTPATPRTPMPGGMFMGPLAPASLDDSLAQQQQQQQLLAQSEAPRPLFMHHNSSSVDLGSIASTFSVPQFHPALSGHMSPVGPYPGMPGMLPQPFYPPQASLLAATMAGMPNGGDALNMDDLDDEDDDDDCPDGDYAGRESARRLKAASAAAAARDAAEPAGTSKARKPKAMYKRFRNSFIFFANEQRKQWRREHPELSKIQNRGFIQDMSKVWNSMSSEEKAPYVQMATEDKRRYEADVKRFGPLPTSAQSSATSTPKEHAAGAQPAAELPPAKDRPRAEGPATPLATAPASATATPALASPLHRPVMTSLSVSPLSVSPLAVTPGMMSPAVAAPGAMICDPFDPDTSQVTLATYHTFLHSAFGQDFSPHAADFDPSCFYSDAMAVDGQGCADPARLAAWPSGSPMLASEAGADASAAAGGRAGANCPPIATLVGTKRKCGSDGQPMTSLPSSIKRFRNSFIYYVNEKRAELQYNADGSPTNVEINNREFLKNMSARWRAMPDDEKAPYLQMADDDKERFTRQMREYELEHPGERERGSKLRRRRSSAGTGAGADGAAQPHDQCLAAAECAGAGLNIALGPTFVPPEMKLEPLPGCHPPCLPAVPEEAGRSLSVVLEDAREGAVDM